MSNKHKHWQEDPYFGGPTKTGTLKRCFESHPPLPIPVGDTIYKVYGGSCSTPLITDADVYVGFDMSHKRTDKAYPWVEGESFLYYIQDMHAPSDPESFKHLISWLADQLVAGKKVHLGCIGGHGRTGTVLAALVTFMTGEKDSITYVREHYCEKAVESAVQVRFLNQHFGIKEVMGHKEYAYGTTTGRHSGKSVNASGSAKDGWSPNDWRTKPKPAETKPTPVAERASLPKGVKDISPTKHRMAIWAPSVLLDKSADSGIITA